MPSIELTDQECADLATLLDAVTQMPAFTAARAEWIAVLRKKLAPQRAPAKSVDAIIADAGKWAATTATHDEVLALRATSVDTLAALEDANGAFDDLGIKLVAPGAFRASVAAQRR